MRFKTLLLPLLAAPLLAGCILSDDSEVDRRLTLSARWVHGDSMFVFTVHDEESFEGMPRGRMAHVRLFRAKVDSARQNLEYAEIYDLPGAWGCSDLRMRDSLLLMSFYPYPAQDGADQEGCPSTRNGSSVFAAVLMDTPGASLTPLPDTTGKRSQLLQLDAGKGAFDEGFERRGNPRAGYDICLVNGPCLGQLVRDWDAGG